MDVLYAGFAGAKTCVKNQSYVHVETLLAAHAEEPAREIEHRRLFLI